jgi:hypothetical protein
MSWKSDKDEMHDMLREAKEAEENQVVKTSYPWMPEDIREYYDKYLKVLSTYSHTSSAEFVELLVESCLAEKNLNEGLITFLSYVKQEGLQIETEQENLNKEIARFSNLRFIRKLLHATGLGAWEDEIIKMEIQKMYRTGVDAPRFIPVKGVT